LRIATEALVVELALRAWTTLGGVEAGPRDAEHPAEHRVVCLLRGDEAVHRRYLRPVSVAKKAAVAVA